MIAESYKDEIVIIYNKIRMAKTRLLEIQGANVETLSTSEEDTFDSLDDALTDVKNYLGDLVNWDGID